MRRSWPGPSFEGQPVPDSTPEDGFKRVIELVRSVVKPEGFKKRGNHFYRVRGITSQLIHTQKSAWGSGDDPIQFTFNLCFMVHGLEANTPPESVSYDRCSFRCRIGEVLEGPDLWWQVASEPDACALTDELAVIFRDRVLGFADEASCRQGIVRIADRFTGLVGPDLRAWVEAHRTPSGNEAG